MKHLVYYYCISKEVTLQSSDPSGKWPARCQHVFYASVP